MSEESVIDAAEREMDLYRAEIERITDQRNRCSETADQLRGQHRPHPALGRGRPHLRRHHRRRRARDGSASVIDEWGNWFESHLPGHHHTSAASAAAAVTIEPTTQEEPVISVAEIEADIHVVAAKFEQVDKAALSKLDAVQANPRTNEAFELIAAVAHVDPGPFFEGAMSILRLLAGQAASVPAEPSFTPAGPQVAGQA